DASWRFTARSPAEKPRWRCIASPRRDRKSTRLNSSHSSISYAVFCLKKNTLPQHPEANQVLGEVAAELDVRGVSAANYVPMFFFKGPGAPQDLPLFPEGASSL